jgi:hypothetical protein
MPGSQTGVVDDRITLGEVLVFRLSTDEPGQIPYVHVLKADRGSRKGQFLLLTTTESRQDAGMRQPGAVGGAEYHLIGPEKVGVLPDVDVIGVHYLKIRPGRTLAFERFVTQKLHPALANLRPDLRILYYKPISGSTGGNYLAVFALTQASRDKYWPGGADSDQLRAAFSSDLAELRTELVTYLVEGSYAADSNLAAAVFESREWTDFVLVSAGAPPPRPKR